MATPSKTKRIVLVSTDMTFVQDSKAAFASSDLIQLTTVEKSVVELRGEIQAKQPPPGSMGLGTNVPVVEPPKGWQRPKKPDLKTNVKSRKR